MDPASRGWWLLTRRENTQAQRGQAPGEDNHGTRETEVKDRQAGPGPRKPGEVRTDPPRSLPKGHGLAGAFMSDAQPPEPSK